MSRSEKMREDADRHQKLADDYKASGDTRAAQDAQNRADLIRRCADNV